MKAKRIVAIVALAIILIAGLYSVIFAYTNIAKTYDGSDVNVVDLYNNPTQYDVSDPDGVADIIVKQNLEKTMAANNVAAVVFDFRGFDTLGESFILLTAIAGAYVILSKSKKSKKEDEQ
ncbi:MAG: hypothetical protein II996_01620 [Oscillospiraceae bacterium]|nr:hypothetical protein [Oscillospiraceae bacterium]